MRISTKAIARLFALFGYLFLPILVASASEEKSTLDWQHIADLPPVGGQSDALGVAGPFVGVHNDALIIAGGANFVKPYWGMDKEWHDTIWVLEREGDSYTWHEGGKLPRPLGYGSSVSTSEGVLCMGGNDASNCYDDTFLLKWNPDTRKVEIESYPALPSTCAFSLATMIGDKVYLAGGTRTNDLSSAMTNFWMLDLSKRGVDDFGWQELPGWPGPARGLSLTVAQHNGEEDQVFVLSGRRIGDDGEIEFLKDAYAFSPIRYMDSEDTAWKRISDSPVCMMAGEAIPVGQSHIFVIGGADGSLFHKADELKDGHPGFPKKAWAYNTITNTWFEANSIPQNHVTTQVAKWGDDYILASGEVRPRVRTPMIWKISPVQTSSTFGWLDYSTIVIYLAFLIGIGVYFLFKNKSTDDYFRGGQKIPWWAAGCSIFATMLSSLTFMSLPAKVYATDWVYFLYNFCILLLAPVIIFMVLPFFRGIDATSAYEYLEKRFNLLARMFASTFYIIFQVGRMAIVMFLPALALATVTPISVETCILVMGIMSLIYCTIGGVEAVIWTDTLQTFVLLGGALLSFIVIVFSLDGGLGYFWATSMADSKMNLVNWDFGSNSYMIAAAWVVLLGGIAGQLTPYSSDQGVVQRYMSTSSKKKATQSIWTNAWLSMLASLLFFSLGTALYVFYKQNPAELDPTLQNDSVFPQFIASKLPVGIAGLVIAGVFAAAQSTISTSMNSIATVFTTDFLRRFNVLKSERSYFRSAQVATLVAGILGTGFALLLASADIKSMFDHFIKVIGMFGSPIAGLFMLGMLTKKAHGRGAFLGAICGIVMVYLIQNMTGTHPLLYATVGLCSAFFFGYLFSIVIPSRDKDIKGLTVFTLPKSD
ncbi:MAG: sodium/solute symporter [Puniceicoccaceae bacterium]